jgi:hypothetical protein
VILRRLLLLAQFLFCLSLVACATPQVICDVRDYQSPVLIPSRGEVRLTWEYRQDLPQGRYGYAVCDAGGLNCHVQLKAPAPAWQDVCGLHTYFHELLHALGGRHE